MPAAESRRRCKQSSIPICLASPMNLSTSSPRPLLHSEWRRGWPKARRGGAARFRGSEREMAFGGFSPRTGARSIAPPVGPPSLRGAMLRAPFRGSMREIQGEFSPQSGGEHAAVQTLRVHRNTGWSRSRLECGDFSAVLRSARWRQKRTSTELRQKTTLPPSLRLDKHPAMSHAG